MGQTSLDEIRVTLRKLLPAFRDKYSINYLGVFGAYVKNTQSLESDLDLLISFNEAPGLFTYIEIENNLSEALGIKVDLVMKDALKPYIAKRVLNEVIEI